MPQKYGSKASSIVDYRMFVKLIADFGRLILIIPS